VPEDYPVVSSLTRYLQTQNGTDPFLMHLHSLLVYSHANRAVLKLRDQKQMDFEELTDYLSSATSERDRLSAVISGHAGSTGLGIGSYLREKVDALRGADDDRSRVEKMRKLDVRIKEVCVQVLVAKVVHSHYEDSYKRRLRPLTIRPMPSARKRCESKRFSSTEKKPR